MNIETTDGGTILIILAMALVTLVTRWGGVFVMSFIPIGYRVQQFITAMSGSVLVALLAPLAVEGDAGARMALLSTAVVMLVWKKPLPAISAGLIAAALVRLTMTKHYLGIVNRLRQLIPTLFSDTTPERTVVWHDDLSLSNMITGEDGNLNGIIDWECVSTIPIWAATDTPSFLRSQDRHGEPRPERYLRRAPTVDIYGRDDEGLDDKYWRDLEDYEFTILRAHYDSCRRHHNPWCKNDLPKDEKLKYDFLDAINLCRAQDLGGAVDDWIDELEEGNIIALEYDY